MKLPGFNKRILIRALLGLAAVLLTLAVLVLIPLLTHREPVPEPRFTERRAVPTPTPQPTPEPTPVVSYAAPSIPEQDDELQQLMADFAAQHPGEWDICVYNLTGGETAGFRTQEEPLLSSGLIRLFIMGGVFQQIEEGALRYWDNYSFICRMIVAGDSSYTNLLIGYLGVGDIEAGYAYLEDFLRSVGCDNTVIHQLTPEKAEDAVNRTSAEDCALFLKKMYRLELVSPEYSSAMVEILKAQISKDFLPAGLPADTVCAHMPGDLSQLVCADAGLIFSPGADYILAVINNHPENDDAAKAAIRELSAQVYAYFNPPGTQPAKAELSEP